MGVLGFWRGRRGGRRAGGLRVLAVPGKGGKGERFKVGMLEMGGKRGGKRGGKMGGKEIKKGGKGRKKGGGKRGEKGGEWGGRGEKERENGVKTGEKEKKGRKEGEKGRKTGEKNEKKWGKRGKVREGKRCEKFPIPGRGRDEEEQEFLAHLECDIQEGPGGKAEYLRFLFGFI